MRTHAILAIVSALLALLASVTLATAPRYPYPIGRHCGAAIPACGAGLTKGEALYRVCALNPKANSECPSILTTYSMSDLDIRKSMHKEEIKRLKILMRGFCEKHREDSKCRKLFRPFSDYSVFPTPYLPTLKGMGQVIKSAKQGKKHATKFNKSMKNLKLSDSEEFNFNPYPYMHLGKNIINVKKLKRDSPVLWQN